MNVVLNRKMSTAQVVETSVTVNNNSPIQDYVHPDDQTQPTFEVTPGFKTFQLYQHYLKLLINLGCSGLSVSGIQQIENQVPKKRERKDRRAVSHLCLHLN